MLERIKKTSVTLTAGLIAASTGLGNAHEESYEGLITNSVENATLQVKQACPRLWEDLGVPIPDDLDPSGEALWGLDDNTELDKEEYYTFIQGLPGSETQSDDPYSDVDQIKKLCTIARTSLLNIFYSGLPQSVVASMPELTYDPGPAVDGFLVGDLRHTGRPEPAEGWLFLTGQTIGPVGSSADLKGEEYRALFEIAREWWRDQNDDGSHDTGDLPSWDSDDVVRLPDMRGRTIVANDIMNGAAAGTLTLDKAKIVGGSFGQEQETLTLAELPRHKHTLKSGGIHSHSMDKGGVHSHNQKTSAYGGTNYWGNHDYGGDVKGRTKAENTITKAIQNSISHKHTIHNSTSHTHTLEYEGSGKPFERLQPSVTFNVEMKFK